MNLPRTRFAENQCKVLSPGEHAKPPLRKGFGACPQVSDLRWNGLLTRSSERQIPPRSRRALARWAFLLSWVILSNVRVAVRCRVHTDIQQRGAAIRLASLFVLTRLISKPMVQSASPHMAVSLVPVISGRAGGAVGRERAKTNARQRETLQVQRQAEIPYGTGRTAEICYAARVVGNWDEPLDPPSQGGSVGSNPIGATARNPCFARVSVRLGSRSRRSQSRLGPRLGHMRFGGCQFLVCMGAA